MAKDDEEGPTAGDEDPELPGANEELGRRAEAPSHQRQRGYSWCASPAEREVAASAVGVEFSGAKGLPQNSPAGSMIT